MYVNLLNYMSLNYAPRVPSQPQAYSLLALHAARDRTGERLLQALLGR